MMKIAVIGASGLVGNIMLASIEESTWCDKEILCVATDASAGKKIKTERTTYTLRKMEEVVKESVAVALFSAGSEVSLQYAPLFADKGAYVVDNSSAWRTDPTKKLIVPEINASLLTPKDKIIANPNCATIQLVMVLYPLYQRFGLQRVIVSTYQAVTGSGRRGVAQLRAEQNGEKVVSPIYPYPIYENILPQIDIFLENGYTKEENKIMQETRKILGDEKINITATAVRVPIIGGHSESVHVSLKKPFDLNEVRTILSTTPGITLCDDPQHQLYPMPLHVQGKTDVFVGRIRRDESASNSLALWIVSDNLYKGAATNAVQIVDYLYHQKWIE